MAPELLATAIGNSLGVSLHAQPASRVHGGSINECYRWEGDTGPLFVKIAPARGSAMLEAEAAGLEELSRAQAVRVPRVLSVGTSAGKAWLALEWIRSGAPSDATDAVLGEQHPSHRTARHFESIRAQARLCQHSCRHSGLAVP